MQRMHRVHDYDSLPSALTGLIHAQGDQVQFNACHLIAAFQTLFLAQIRYEALTRICIQIKYGLSYNSLSARLFQPSVAAGSPAYV